MTTRKFPPCSAAPRPAASRLALAALVCALALLPAAAARRVSPPSGGASLARQPGRLPRSATRPARLPASPRAAAAPTAKFKIAVNRPGRTIPRGFAGFSIEVDAAARLYLGPAGVPNRVFYQLMKNLGPATLRIGGNSTDDSCWQPSRAPHPQGCHFTIQPADVRGFADASAATGWGIIAGVNLAQNDPAWAAHYAAAVARAFAQTPGAHLLGFELGNEPDLFRYHVLFDHVTARPASYSPTDYLRDWHAYARALRARPITARVPLYGPAICCGWLRPGPDNGLHQILAGIGRQDLHEVTVHAYPLTHCGHRQPTVAQLLSPALLRRYQTKARQWVGTAHHFGFPIRYGEGNSISCEGQNGISNAFAETAWATDWLFTNFRVGMAGVNFHDGGHVISLGYHGRAYYYDAVQVERSEHNGRVTYHNQIWPLYYAMYAFAQNAAGGRLLPVRAGAAADQAAGQAAPAAAEVTAYAVRHGAAVTVFVVNHALDAAVPVALAPSRRLPRARLLLVRAPSDASRDVTYGGRKFSPATGRLAGRPQWRTLPVAGDGAVRFTLPQAAVAIVRLQGK